MKIGSRFLSACRREKVDATPVWFMRQAGRYMSVYRKIRESATILEICEKPELAAEVTLQPVRRLGVDAAILFADILLPVRPMGVKLEFKKGEGPCLTPPVRGAKEIDALRTFEPKEELSFVMETLRLVRRELDGAPTANRGPVALIGFAGAPFTLASYLIEGGPSDHYLHTKAMMHAEPALWDRLMKKIVTVTAAYLKAQIQAGAQAVQLFDSWIGALSQEDYKRFVQPHTAEVIKKIQGSGAPVIHFGTGTAGFLEDFKDAGGDVVSVDWRIPLSEAWPRIGYDRAIQGNLDPVFLGLPLKKLKGLVRGVIDQAGGRPGHIFNLGHGILPHTPEGNVKAVTDWVHEITSR